jgi:hypothetical protein
MLWSVDIGDVNLCGSPNALTAGIKEDRSDLARTNNTHVVTNCCETTFMVNMAD